MQMNSLQYGKFAEIYDALMTDYDYDAWADYVVMLLNKHSCCENGMRIAECACGTGAITRRLKRRGFDIVGADISEDMLRIAQERTRHEGLTIPFVNMDMRKLTLHKKVKCIISVCDGVNYLTSVADMHRFFVAARENLAAGGVLMFDISSRSKLINTLGNNSFVQDNEENAYIWRNTFDEERSLLEMNITFFTRRGELFERFSERHVQRAHKVEEVLSQLSAAGFTDIAVYNCFSTETVTDDAERVQFVAHIKE